MKTARFAGLAACALALATLVSPALSAQQNQGRSKKYKPTKEITVDKQTGTLRLPTAEETDQLVSQLAAMTNRSSEGLQATRAANGTLAVNLDDRFQSVMLARPNADGTTEVRCVTTFEEAAEFLGLVEASQQ